VGKTHDLCLFGGGRKAECHIISPRSRRVQDVLFGITNKVAGKAGGSACGKSYDGLQPDERGNKNHNFNKIKIREKPVQSQKEDIIIKKEVLTGKKKRRELAAIAGAGLQGKFGVCKPLPTPRSDGRLTGLHQMDVREKGERLE